MTRGRLRLPLTLRGRLLAGLLALLAVLCAVIGVVSISVLHHQVVHQVDRQLSAAGQRAGNDDPGGPPGHPRPPGRGAAAIVNVIGQPAKSLGAIVIDGTVRSAITLKDQAMRSDLTTEEVPKADWPRLAEVAADGKPHTIELSTLGDYRVLATANPSAENMVRIIGLPLKDANATVYTLIIVITIVSVAGLLGAAVAGSVIVRLALRPLRRMTETATRVSKLPLDRGEVALQERVPEADTDPRTEVGQVGAALNSMLGHVATALTARQASEMRVRQFVADASHELRTPLAAIRGYAELTRRTGDDLPSDITYAMARVESEATRMTGLVEDLLLLARLDTGRPIDMEKVDLTALIIDAVSDAHAAGPAHPVRLELPEEPVEVIGNPARLHQVFTNLLTNARTHTAPGTSINVRLRKPDADDSAPAAVVEVADEGPGIAPELLPHIFERFARADTSRSRKAGSTGLGLAIVSAVVSAHGGRVDVQTRPGRTVFAVRLPASTGQEPGKPHSAP